MKRFILALGILLALIGSASAASRFAVCTVTCTWDNASTAMWSASSGGATGQSAPVAGDLVTLDAATCVGGVTCTITVAANLAMTSLTMGACTAATTGCILDFSVNNNTVAISGGNFNVSGSGTRTLKLGSSVVTITNGVWNSTTVTNFTLQTGTSTIVYAGPSNTARTFVGGGQTYSTVTIAANTGSGIVQFNDGGNTFGTLNITGPNYVQFTFSVTNTVTNPITWSGTATKQLLITTDSGSFASTIAQGASNASMNWVAFNRITMTGAGTRAAANSFNLGNNTGFTITAPASIGGSSVCILGGWLLWRDLPEHINDNFPAWLEKAA